MTPYAKQARDMFRKELIKLLSGELSACCMDDEDERDVAADVISDLVIDFTMGMIKASLMNTFVDWFGEPKESEVKIEKDKGWNDDF